MKLVSVVRSNDGTHKYEATFEDSGKTIKSKFGAQGMDDYTITHDVNQRDRYRTRHKKDLQTHDITRAGYLSYYLLWGNSTSLNENIQEFKKKFNV